MRGSWQARKRALILLAVVLDVPLLARLVCRLTAEPRVEAVEVDGVPVDVLRPGREGPWPAWLFVNGAHPLRRREPVVWRLARGLARAGFLVVVPDLPGLGEGAITARTLEATAAVTRAAVEWPDVRDGRIALIGASTGAGLAVLTAGRPDLADRISVVAAVAPYANLDKLVCMATTSHYEEEAGFERYEVTDLHRQVVGRSLVAALPDARDREQLLAALDRGDGFGESTELSPEAQSVVRLLGNRDPARFRELYAALPQTVLGLVEQLSPLGVAAHLRAPIEVVVPPHDDYFPLGEAEALAASLPNVRLTVTATLDHTRPSLGRLKEYRSFDGFVVRGLAAAAATSSAFADRDERR